MKRLFVNITAGLILLLFLVSCSSATSTTTTSTTSSSSSSTFDSSVPNYSSAGTITTNIDSAVPAWIKNNFTNIRAYVSGSNIVIETRSYPPYHTYYYGSSSSYYDAATIPTVTNPNKVAERAVTLTVPKTPTISASTLNNYKSSAGLGIIGVSVNGVVLFNDDANTAAGDEIVNEIPTMDTKGGHPTLYGVYHYHVEPAVLSKTGSDPNGDTSQAGDELLGIAIDGLPIFGPKDSVGSLVFDAGGTSSAANSTDYRAQNNWIAASSQTHPPTLYSDATNGAGLPDVHYQVVSNFYLATTKSLTKAAGGTIASGTIEPDFYMIGDNIAGTKGSQSDSVSP